MARHYSSQFGRFLQPDPAGTSATCLFNPQTQNRYVYVTDNPLNHTDPTGLCGDGDNSDCGGIGITLPIFPGGGGSEQPAPPTPHPVFGLSELFDWRIGPRTVTALCVSPTTVPEGRFRICHFGCTSTDGGAILDNEIPLAELIPACGPITKCPHIIEETETVFQIGPWALPGKKKITSCQP